MRDLIGDPEADSNLLKRDNVFVLLNFNLEGGGLKLVGKDKFVEGKGSFSETTLSSTAGLSNSGSVLLAQTASDSSLLTAKQRSKEGLSKTPESLVNRSIIELEFSAMKMSFESRLRTSSSLFSAKLGGLFVRDMVTKDSRFPNLIAPQKKVSYKHFCCTIR